MLSIEPQVSGNYEDLISQAAGVEKLEAHLEMMTTHMDTLSAASERLRARVVEPYKVIRYTWLVKEILIFIWLMSLMWLLYCRYALPSPVNKAIAGLKQ